MATQAFGAGRLNRDYLGLIGVQFAVAESGASRLLASFLLSATRQMITRKKKIALAALALAAQITGLTPGVHARD